MVGNLALEALFVLFGCAVVLGLIALYYRLTDPASIDEEAEEEVRNESPEERAAALRSQEERRERTQVEEDEGGYMPDDR
jgi:hypothetical protein